MTSEQQRIAIAEWMGWKWELHKKESNWWLTNPEGRKQVVNAIGKLKAESEKK